jgi:hypothetical protein
MQVIQFRRGLIDRITGLMPQCKLFNANAIYPKRFFDDVMVDYTKTVKKLIEVETRNFKH